MKSYNERIAEAQSYYQQGEARAKATSNPPEQKFPKGTRVRIDNNLGPSMQHFPSNRNATVIYTYSQAHRGNNYKSYCLDIDGVGKCSWYEEQQLTAI